MKRAFLIVVLAFLAAAVPAAGCRRPGRFYHEFAESEYVFIGKVTGYTELATGFEQMPATKRKVELKGYGLKVQPTGVLNAPTLPAKYFEAFPFVYSSDCARAGMVREAIEQAYPVGTEVRLVMEEASVFRADVPEGVVRLEEIPAIDGSLMKNEGPRFRTTIDALFDYRAFKYDPLGADRYAEKCLVEFELRKDLYRLEVAKTRADRQAIMNRLRFAPKGVDFDFKVIRFTFRN